MLTSARRSIAATLAILPGLTANSAAHTQTIRYVNATPGGNGQSCALAFRHLQDALAAAQAGDQIWVAAGTYKPDRSAAHAGRARPRYPSH